MDLPVTVRIVFTVLTTKFTFIPSYTYVPVPAPTAMNCGMYTGNVQGYRMDKQAKMIPDSNVSNDSINFYAVIIGWYNSINIPPVIGTTFVQ